MEASMEQLSIPLPPWAVRAGARSTIYHDPSQVTAAIVTCGGLCPGGCAPWEGVGVYGEGWVRPVGKAG